MYVHVYMCVQIHVYVIDTDTYLSSGPGKLWLLCSITLAKNTKTLAEKM